MPITAETLTLAALLIAPGVIAVLIGITLGVVEQEVDRDLLYLTSFVSSIGIDLVFIWIVQLTGGRISSREELEATFFGSTHFHIEKAVLLFALSCGFGLLYAIGLTYNLADTGRRTLARFTSHRRNPWQPWVGGLRDAKVVQVTLNDADETEVVGLLNEYSRAEKERQLVLHKPQFDFEEEPNREKVILTDDEFRHVQVRSTRQRKGPKYRFYIVGKSFLHAINEFISGYEAKEEGSSERNKI